MFEDVVVKGLSRKQKPAKMKFGEDSYRIKSKKRDVNKQALRKNKLDMLEDLWES